MSVPLAAERADLAHVDCWLFDLDNTLYPLSSGLAEIVSARITEFVADLTGLPAAEAHALQKRYLADYGLTLAGMVERHGVDPDVYHAMFEDLPLEVIRPDPVLAASLSRLPGRRLVFTNADEGHAGRVLRRLGLEALFDDIFHIGSANRSGGLAPKPKPEAFARLMAAHPLEPSATAFFDDSERNLAPAAALGMTTVLVGGGGSPGPAARYATDDLAGFLAAARLKELP